MVAEVVDAVVGVDTHRDTHQAEIAGPAGVPIATTQIPNTSAGFTALLGWMAEHSPGPRILLAVEGSRSYGIGLTRAAAAAGLAVIEVGRPTRTHRRGVGKSDPIDAHLAVSTALRPGPTSCLLRARTATARACASCSAPEPNSSLPPPVRPTGCARCCWPATTPTGRPPETH